MSSTLPLFPTDDSWPYPDVTTTELVADAPDFDALELLGPHVYDDLTAAERDILFSHFGLQGRTPLSMKELASELGCTHGEVREILGSAIDKIRVHLLVE